MKTKKSYNFVLSTDSVVASCFEVALKIKVNATLGDSIC